MVDCMPLKIAICDDTDCDRDAVGNALHTYVSEEHINCSITAFDSAAKVLACSGFDLYFLDIMMPLMDGMCLAQKLRDLYPDCGIVFITSSADYAVCGYNVDAVGYLLKPLRQGQLHSTFRRVFSRYAPQTLELTIHGSQVDTPISTILFMESQLRNTVIYLKNGDPVFLHQKLEDVWKEAQMHNAFVRCHKSFVVNLDCVLQMENNSFRLIDGTEVPISRSARADSKAAYYRRKMRTGGGS
ncbi:MAG: response regulator transcription factor [Clostridia bacterium]|nr:response regulator transcription factor [Clostridia bacterium]